MQQARDLMLRRPAYVPAAGERRVFLSAEPCSRHSTVSSISAIDLLPVSAIARSSSSRRIDITPDLVRHGMRVPRGRRAPRPAQRTMVLDRRVE